MFSHPLQAMGGEYKQHFFASTDVDVSPGPQWPHPQIWRRTACHSHHSNIHENMMNNSCSSTFSDGDDEEGTKFWRQQTELHLRGSTLTTSELALILVDVFVVPFVALWWLVRESVVQTLESWTSVSDRLSCLLLYSVFICVFVCGPPRSVKVPDRPETGVCSDQLLWLQCPGLNSEAAVAQGGEQQQ